MENCMKVSEEHLTKGDGKISRGHNTELEFVEILIENN